jgi:hypothetical protein
VVEDNIVVFDSYEDGDEWEDTILVPEVADEVIVHLMMK